MADIAVLVGIPEVVDSLVGHKVGVVEEQSVETQAVGKHEVVGSLPLVLGVDTGLVELNPCRRSGLAVISVGKADYFGSSAVDEVINTCVAIVTGTVPNIDVVGHLVLEVEASGNLVIAAEVGKVVLDAEVGVVDGVVPGEQLVAEGHVVAVGTGTVLDIDERELVGGAAAHVVKLGVGHEQLVGEPVGKTAVEVERNGAYDIVHRIHRIGVAHAGL